MNIFKKTQLKTLALTAVVTALLGSNMAMAQRPMRGVPIKKKTPKVLSLKKSATHSSSRFKKISLNKKVGNSIQSSGLVLQSNNLNTSESIQLPQSCRFVPFSVNAPLWIPIMYIEPSEEFKGVYLPLVSEGMIAKDPQSVADASRVWPKSDKNWMAVAEADYTSYLFDLESNEGQQERDLILGLHDKIINRTQSDYLKDRVAKNYISNSVLTASENALLQTVYNRFAESSWANDYNKSLCDRHVGSGETNQGVVMRAKSAVSAPAGRKVDDVYAVTSSSLYAISDLYNSGGQNGIVGYDRQRSFIVGYVREGAETTHVFGCNVCKPIAIEKDIHHSDRGFVSVIR